MTEQQSGAAGLKHPATGRRVAVLDLNNGVPNLGLRSIVDTVETAAASSNGVPVVVEVFDVRGKSDFPAMDFDVFISTGGPGSPFDGEGEPWEKRYFEWLGEAHTLSIPTLFICHSFELMIRFFGLAEVDKRHSPSFGIFPVYLTPAAQNDPVLRAIDNPFYAADFRDWQVVKADRARFKELDATILALEKIRDHVPLERAIMAVRVGPNMLGVQFHPEASAEGMALHFLQDEKMKSIVKTYGADTFAKMMALLEEPNALGHTHATVIPRFLDCAFSN